MAHSRLVNQSKKHIAILLLLLFFGTANGVWCFSSDENSAPPRIELLSCDTVPISCLPSKNFVAQKERNLPESCQDCLDLSFEKLTAGLQSSRVDFVFSPALSQYFHDSTVGSVLASREATVDLFSAHLKKFTVNIHPIISSTILII